MERLESSVWVETPTYWLYFKSWTRWNGARGMDVCVCVWMSWKTLIKVVSKNWNQIVMYCIGRYIAPINLSRTLAHWFATIYTKFCAIGLKMANHKPQMCRCDLVSSQVAARITIHLASKHKLWAPKDNAYGQNTYQI